MDERWEALPWVCHGCPPPSFAARPPGGVPAAARVDDCKPLHVVRERRVQYDQGRLVTDTVRMKTRLRRFEVIEWSTANLMFDGIDSCKARLGERTSSMIWIASGVHD